MSGLWDWHQATAGPESRRTGSSTISASTPLSRNCSATTKRKSALVMTIGRANNSALLTRASTCWKVVVEPTRDELLRHALPRDGPQARSGTAAPDYRDDPRQYSSGPLLWLDSSSRPGTKRQAVWQQARGSERIAQSQNAIIIRSDFSPASGR